MPKKPAPKAPESSDQPQMPVLYTRLVPLRSDIHKELKAVQGSNFGFAAKVNAIPIVIDEFESVARHYPIVFAASNPGVVLAVLGIRDGQNLFVAEDGSWQEGAYIPAYIRRYPFFVAKIDEESAPILCVDDTSSLLSPEGNLSLFENGKSSAHLNRIIGFTQSVQTQLDKTAEFVQAMEAEGLLTENQAVFKRNGQVSGSVTGFKTLDQEKFMKLKGTTLKKWLGKSWLQASILHMASMGNFERVRRLGDPNP